MMHVFLRCILLLAAVLLVNGDTHAERDAPLQADCRCELGPSNHRVFPRNFAKRAEPVTTVSTRTVFSTVTRPFIILSTTTRVVTATKIAKTLTLTRVVTTTFTQTETSTAQKTETATSTRNLLVFETITSIVSKLSTDIRTISSTSTAMTISTSTSTAYAIATITWTALQLPLPAATTTTDDANMMNPAMQINVATTPTSQLVTLVRVVTA